MDLLEHTTRAGDGAGVASQSHLERVKEQNDILQKVKATGHLILHRLKELYRIETQR